MAQLKFEKKQTFKAFESTPKQSFCRSLDEPFIIYIKFHSESASFCLKNFRPQLRLGKNTQQF